MDRRGFMAMIGAALVAPFAVKKVYGPSKLIRVLPAIQEYITFYGPDVPSPFYKNNLGGWAARYSLNRDFKRMYRGKEKKEETITRDEENFSK